jgi:GDP-6-deoxy-D-talose 4-dehydrogenase
MENRSKVLVTGSYGFTGGYLTEYLSSSGYQPIALKSNLMDIDGLLVEIQKVQPDYVIHLAGMSFPNTKDIESLYRVNVIGSINLLDALASLTVAPKKVILASSSQVYSDFEAIQFSESFCPKPQNHYGCSKLSMENLAATYASKLPIIMARPFNYTGKGHEEKFLIPKIVATYSRRDGTIYLGNLDIAREFNDVRDVCQIYCSLLASKYDGGAVNICSGRQVKLLDIINMMDHIAGYKMEVLVNPQLERSNEIKDICGDTAKLTSITHYNIQYSIGETLKWMYG